MKISTLSLKVVTCYANWSVKQLGKLQKRDTRLNDQSNKIINEQNWVNKSRLWCVGGGGGGGGVEATNLATSIGYDLPNIVFCQI